MDHGKLCSETWSSWIHLQNSNVKLMLNDPLSITKREGNFLNEEKRKKLGIDVKQVPPIGGPHLFLICPRERSIQQDPLLHTHSWLLQLFCSSFCKVEIFICPFSAINFLEGPAKMHCNCYNCHYLFFSGIQTILWHNLHGGKLKCFNAITFILHDHWKSDHKQLVVCESLVRKRKKINVRTKS